MIKNGLYSLAAVAIDGVDVEVGGSLIVRDGKLHGGDSYVFYTGTYNCSDGKWTGEMISQEHTPTTRPMAERVQHIEFSGTYNDAGAEADATAGSSTSNSAAPTTTPVPRPMPQPSLASDVFDTMQRCAY